MKLFKAILVGINTIMFFKSNNVQAKVNNQDMKIIKWIISGE